MTNSPLSPILAGSRLLWNGHYCLSSWSVGSPVILLNDIGRDAAVFYIWAVKPLQSGRRQTAWWYLREDPSSGYHGGRQFSDIIYFAREIVIKHCVFKGKASCSKIRMKGYPTTWKKIQIVTRNWPVLNKKELVSATGESENSDPLRWKRRGQLYHPARTGPYVEASEDYCWLRNCPQINDHKRKQDNNENLFVCSVILLRCWQ